MFSSNWESDLKYKFGNDIYDSRLRKITFEEEFNNYILLSVTTPFIRDWITSRYLDQILQTVKSHKSEISRIELSLNSSLAKEKFEPKDVDKIEKPSSNISFIKDFVFQMS